MTAITQADREAAASGYFAWCSGNPVIPDKMRAGKADDHSMVQAFARHREQARKQRQEARDFESMAMASAFRAHGTPAPSTPPLSEEVTMRPAIEVWREAYEHPTEQECAAIIEALTAEVERLRTALRFYAAWGVFAPFHDDAVIIDSGKVARAALEGTSDE